MASWFGKRGKPNEISAAEFAEEYEVPHFESAILDVLRILRDDDSANADIAHALAVDPGTSVRIIRLVNSAAFGLRQPVQDLAQAVQIIGRSSLESMLIATAVRDTLPTKSTRGFNPTRFWLCCAQRAAVAGALATRSTRSLCWTAALLQDCAVPLLAERLSDDYTDLLERWRAEEGPLHELEQEAYGWDHATIASSICERWEFPPALTDAIAGHHPPDDGKVAAPIPVVLVGFLREGDDRPGVDDLLEAASVRFDLDESSTTSAVEEGFEQAEEIASMLS